LSPGTGNFRRGLPANFGGGFIPDRLLLPRSHGGCTRTGCLPGRPAGGTFHHYGGIPKNRPSHRCFETPFRPCPGRGLPLQGTRRKPDCFYRRVRKKLKEIIFLINILKKSKILIENKYLIMIKTIHFILLSEPRFGPFWGRHGRRVFSCRGHRPCRPDWIHVLRHVRGCR